jgi:23S rRNA C2498 (ribose-2'-O)-methylase RlmM
MDVGMADAGQGFCDEPMHTEEEERPHQDVFGIDLWGTAPGSWTWAMMDRTSPLMLDDFQGTWQLP